MLQKLQQLIPYEERLAHTGPSANSTDHRPMEKKTQSRICNWSLLVLAILMLEFSGSDSKGYKINGQFAEQMGAGQGTNVSGSAKVNTFSCNSSSTRLNLDVTLDLDKTIRIVFNGSTPNDGLAWMLD